MVRFPVTAALVVLLVLVVVIALLCSKQAVTRGGAPPKKQRRGLDYTKSPHIVVDTLNLTHWLGGKDVKITPEKIVETIDETASILKLRHPGRVMYVLKDRDSEFNDDDARELYRTAAERNGVYVAIAEQYADPPQGVKKTDEHSARGRDDFYIALLARRWRCAVLTEDRLRDFDRFRATLQPFHVYEYAFWRKLPYREFIRPAASTFARLKKPRMVRYAAYFKDDDT